MLLHVPILNEKAQKKVLFIIIMGVLALIQSKAFLQTSASLAPHMYEPHFNLSILSEKVIYYYYILLNISAAL